ncbi:MAG: hypothetical protein ABL933_01445 [Methyloglobulus sp.]|nr:hypothetical protein [Methyloglobulus sp.]
MASILNVQDHRKQSVLTLIAVSTVTSLLTALLLLAYVLPAYYGIDPVGWGAKLGIIGRATPLGTVVVTHTAPSPSQPAAQIANPVNTAASAAVPQIDDPLAVRQDTVELTIPARQSLDYRLAMERDYDLDYHWAAKGGKLTTELRGESDDGNVPSKTFAALKNSDTGKGFFIIPFNGKFGWHWQNKTDQTVTLRLHTKGHYQIVGQINTEKPK